jgi:hypothetical protein
VKRGPLAVRKPRQMMQNWIAIENELRQSALSRCIKQCSGLCKQRPFLIRSSSLFQVSVNANPYFLIWNLLCCALSSPYCLGSGKVSIYGVSLKSPNQQKKKLNEGKEAYSGFAICSGKSSKSLKAMKQTFDFYSPSLGSIIYWATKQSRRPSSNRRVHARSLDRSSDFGGVVDFVCNHSLTGRIRYELHCSYIIRLLTRRSDIKYCP